MALHFTGQVSTGYELIEPNNYETRITLEYKKTNAGDLYINCKFSIRDDVEQEFQRRIIFDGIYKSKTTGEFSTQKINALLAAVNASEANPKWDFEDYDDLIQFLNGKNVKVTVEQQKADPNYPSASDKNIIKYLSYQPTQYKEVLYTETVNPVVEQPKVETKQESKPVGDTIFSEDDDLPF